ncbi:MAG: hypothetical protein JKY48_04320 [Flavobacteriales bacterium]|nr:hypothetical protein [Flavobacteriales bacterium]
MAENRASLIFQESFQTFKVFETLPFEIYGIQIKGHSKTIWQILNHLVFWQEYQLTTFEGKNDQAFDESISWKSTNSPANVEELNQKIQAFLSQIKQIELKASSFLLNDLNDTLMLKTMIELSSHLSFHLGEIILLARLENVYPQPEDMSGFLEDS